jgi:thiamine-phosphate diphosphorylase
MITEQVRSGPAETALLDRIAAAAHAGVTFVQIRQPEMEGGALARLVGRALGRVRGTETRVLVNDRVDVALAAGAHGVQLRGDSVAARRVRAIAPQRFVVGRSVHTPEEGERVVLEGGLDFLMFGTVFETPSKPATKVAGTATLAETCKVVALPVLAVGGMTPLRLCGVAAVGAAGFAAIGLFADTPIEGLPAVVREASAAFESA